MKFEADREAEAAFQGFVFGGLLISLGDKGFGY
jgi:hypothetical protein